MFPGVGGGRQSARANGARGHMARPFRAATGFTLLALALLLLVAAPLPAAATPLCAPPEDALAAGYGQKTFFSTFDKDIDLDHRLDGSFNWYLNKWFHYPATAKADVVPLDGGGVEISDRLKRSNYSIATAAPTNREGTEWVGKVFGGGGYFEAELAFDPTKIVSDDSTTFPAWWMLAIEHMASFPSVFWPGQEEGFRHFSEIDIFEYNDWHVNPRLDTYRSSLHDWFGVFKKTCSAGFCDATNFNPTRLKDFVRRPPIGFSFADYHRYGALWRPATSSSLGQMVFYLDGKPIGKSFQWTEFAGQTPPGRMVDWAHAIMDRQHFALILGTGGGKSFKTRCVGVWQKDDDHNITRR